MGVALSEPSGPPASRMAGSGTRPKPERLVSLQPDVLSDAEHTLGNLLQRLRHAARPATGGAGEPERLQGALEELEEVLELVFDYVSPVDVELRPISAGRIAETLAGQVRNHASGAVHLGDLPPVQMPLDRRLLSRSFALLGRAMRRCWESSSGTFIEASLDEARERVEFRLRSVLPGARSDTHGGREELALAVARRLIELQGGELCWLPAEDQIECRIALPAPRSSNAGQ